MTKTTEIWKLAQRLEPELWARLADGSIPEHVVNNIISDRLAKAEIYTEPRVVSLHHVTPREQAQREAEFRNDMYRRGKSSVVILAEPAIDRGQADILTFGKGGSVSYTPHPSHPCQHCGEIVNGLCSHHHQVEIDYDKI